MGVDRAHTGGNGPKNERRLAKIKVCNHFSKFFKLSPVAETETHEGKRKVESLWPIFK